MTDECPCNLCDMIKHTTWISVKERLPEEGERVLFFCDDVDIGYFFKERGWHFLDGGDWFEINEVTHWMPLPEPPK